MPRRRARLVLLASSLWLVSSPWLAACTGDADAPADDPGAVLVRAGGRTGTLADLRDRWATSRAAGIDATGGEVGDALLRSALSEMLVDVVLLGEAEARGQRPAEAEIERELSGLRQGDPAGFDATVASFPGGLDAYRAFVGRRIARERVEQAVRTELRARVVPDPAAVALRLKELVAAWRDREGEEVRAAQVVARTALDAEAARGRLRAGEPVADVARQLSSAPEATAGGDLGWRGRGSLPPFMEAALFGLDVGEVSEVVRSPYGFHVFLVTDRRSGHAPALDELQARATAERTAEAVEAAWAGWLKERMAASGATVDPAAARLRCCRDGWPYVAGAGEGTGRASDSGATP